MCLLLAVQCIQRMDDNVTAQRTTLESPVRVNPTPWCIRPRPPVLTSTSRYIVLPQEQSPAGGGRGAEQCDVLWTEMGLPEDAAITKALIVACSGT